LTEGLAAAAGRLRPNEAARTCAAAIQSYVQALEQRSGFLDAQNDAAHRLATLLGPLDGVGADHAARALARWLVCNPDLLYNDQTMPVPGTFNPAALERFLTKRTRPQVQRRIAALMVAVGTSAPGPALALPLLPAAGEPLPCRLNTQDLVELLKMPTCAREVRRVILNQLGNRYGRRFDTHWDFVRYAQERKLNLDFTTPPKRPDRNLPPLFKR
jgi:hypothetical protein